MNTIDSHRHGIDPQVWEDSRYGEPVDISPKRPNSITECTTTDSPDQLVLSPQMD